MALLFTHRLQLRPFTPADLPALHTLWTNRQVRRFLWDGDIVSEERAAEYLDESTADFARYGYGMWALSLRAEPHSVVGFCGLRAHAERPFPDLVYGLGPDWWGRGLATEAAQAVAAYVFGRGLVAGIEATVDVPNTGSGQVLEKLGMESRPPTQPGHRLFYLDKERFAAWVERPFVVQIRPVRIEDAPELARVLTETQRATFEGRVPAACLDSPTRFLKKSGFSEKPDFLAGEFLLVAEDMAGRMVGFVLAGGATDVEGDFAEPGQVVRELSVLMVETEWQRKGIGRLLVGQVAAAFKAQGTAAILVGVHAQNPNHAFYRRLGARRVAVRPHDWAGYQSEMVYYLIDGLY